MKNIVIFDDYHVRDLKPPEKLVRYLELTKQDVARILVPAAINEIPCPACGSDEIVGSFEKYGMTYRECGVCHSMYVSPRPDEAALAEYDAKGEARRFWREDLAKSSGEARHEKIIKPRSEWVVDSTREFLPSAMQLMDVGTAQYVYVTELVSSGQFQRVTLVDPVVDVPATDELCAACTWDDVGDEVGVASLFEVADRAADPAALLGRVRDALTDDGLVFVTAVLGSGFDIQVLKDHADNVFPPDRLNLMTVEGLLALAERTGFEVIELSTPGILDVEIVSAALDRDADTPVSPWVRYILDRPEHTRRAFQQFLQSEQLSSYGRAVLRKA